LDIPVVPVFRPISFDPRLRLRVNQRGMASTKMKLKANVLLIADLNRQDAKKTLAYLNGG
jgi:hypothetical protein